MQIVLFLLITILPVSAYQSSLTTTGSELYWANPSIPVAIQTNTTDMGSATAKNIILKSINEWNGTTSAKINVTDSSNNQIRFVSNYPFGSAVLGVTQISFNNAGAIQKASILLNDDHYFHSTQAIYSGGQAYLGDVVTHELGHLLGLSHSEVLNSSMFYSSYAGQNTLSADDKSGVRALYDGGYGTISGYVKGGNSTGVLGAHVQAISRNTGEASSAISDEHGYFQISGLSLNDTYYIYTSPIKNPDSLPGYFSNVQDKFCPGKYVGSFFSACGREYDGKPTGITLSESFSSVDIGTVSINCALRSDQEYDSQKVQQNYSSVTMLEYGSEQKYQKAFVGWFRSSQKEWSLDDNFKIDLRSFGNLSGNPKYLKVALVSYPFGTQLEYQMSVKQNDNLIAAASRKMEKSIITKTYETDFHSFLPLSFSTVQNVFEVNIKARKLTSPYETFPDYKLFTNDQHLPFMIVASLYEDGPSGMKPLLDNEANWSDNEACLDAPYTFSVSRTLNRESESATSAVNDQSVAAAGCGTIEPPSDGPGSSLPLMSAGFLFALLASSLFKSRKKFLS